MQLVEKPIQRKQYFCYFQFTDENAPKRQLFVAICVIMAVNVITSMFTQLMVDVILPPFRNVWRIETYFAVMYNEVMLVGELAAVALPLILYKLRCINNI